MPWERASPWDHFSYAHVTPDTFAYLWLSQGHLNPIFLRINTSETSFPVVFNTAADQIVVHFLPIAERLYNHPFVFIRYFYRGIVVPWMPVKILRDISMVHWVRLGENYWGNEIVQKTSFCSIAHTTSTPYTACSFSDLTLFAAERNVIRYAAEEAKFIFFVYRRNVIFRLSYFIVVCNGHVQFWIRFLRFGRPSIVDWLIRLATRPSTDTSCLLFIGGNYRLLPLTQYYVSR